MIISNMSHAVIMLLHQNYLSTLNSASKCLLSFKPSNQLLGKVSLPSIIHYISIIFKLSTLLFVTSHYITITDYSSFILPTSS